MIIVSENRRNNSYDIKCNYDPELIDLIKNVAGRKWIPEYKIWTIPRNRLGFLLNQLKGTRYERELHIQSSEDININQKLGTTNYIPEVDLSNVERYVQEGGHLYKHQEDFMKYAIYRELNGYTSGFLLADEPGAGKTLEVLQLAMYYKNHKNCKHCLIICCVNTAKYNWQEDILKHTNGKEKPYILGTRLRRNKIDVRHDTGGKEKLDDLKTGHMYSNYEYPELPYFLVINIEAFRHKNGKAYDITSEIINWIKSGEIGMIAIDEIHRNASMHSVQGKQLLTIKKKIKNIDNDVCWIPMTGTPIVSKPTDLFLPLRLVDGHDSDSYYMWCQQYCMYGGFGGYDIVGYKNIDTLKQILEPNMLRRLKKDVLDLPPKIRYTEYIENTPYQKKLYNQIEGELVANQDVIVSSMNPMSQLLKLRQVNGSPELVDNTLVVDKTYLNKNAKAKRLLELIDDIVSNGEKVIVFSNWVEPLRTLYKFISAKYGTCCYTGTMKSDVREKHKQAFITNPKYSVLLGTVGALGVSHTLTVARNVIFYDKPWNASEVVQCEDRIHRPGTAHSVNIYTLVSKDTVDERVEKILSNKSGTANYIVDNQLDLRKNPELFSMLLGSSPLHL